MLEVFRKNLFFTSILLLPYVFIVRIGMLISPVGFVIDESSQTFLTSLVYSHSGDPLTQNIIACLLIFAQGLIVNYIFNIDKISRESTQLSGVFYVLFVSLIANTSGLTPVLIANTFMLLGLLHILNTYKNVQAVSQIFNGGFMIAMASLFYIPYAIFIVFGIFALLQLRSFKLLEKLQFLVGVITPYFLIFTLKFWNDQPFIEIEFLSDIFFRWPDLSIEYSLIEYIAIGVVLIISAACIVFYNTIVSKKAVQAKKKIEILYWFMFFWFLSYLILNTQIEIHLISIAIPISLLLGILSSESKNKIFYELLHLALIIIVFVGQFKLINF